MAVSGRELVVQRGFGVRDFEGLLWVSGVQKQGSNVGTRFVEGFRLVRVSRKMIQKVLLFEGVGKVKFSVANTKKQNFLLQSDQRL